MTQKQMNVIHYHLTFDHPADITEWITPDQWNEVKAVMDIGTASTVIGAFKSGNRAIAINQMLHLIKE